MRLALAALVVGSAASAAYALSRLGRSAVFGELAGSLGDKEAQAVAQGMGTTDAIVSGLRVLTGRNALTDS